MSRLQRFLRMMHTDGRQMPNPNQGALSSISPSPHAHHLPPAPHSDHLGPENAHLQLDQFAPPSASSSKVTPTRLSSKGKPLPTRPPRTIPVRLPSGDLEPTEYPPSSTYIDNLGKDRKPSHPLWQFFHVPAKAKEALTTNSGYPSDFGSLEVQSEEDEVENISNIKSGRSWTAIELRQKSFADLHALWYVLLRERNVLATQREERRRLGVSAREGGDLITKRTFKCRKSMSRIKYVLNERRLGLIAAASPQQSIASFASLTNPSNPLIESTEADETPAIAPEGDVAKEEVESRDEGWGGGKEAKDFVQDVEVKQDGSVEKKP